MATSNTYNVTIQGAHTTDTWIAAALAAAIGKPTKITVGAGIAVNGIPHNHILIEVISK